MPQVLNHPYAETDFIWLRGNLHTHTTNSDGVCSPQDTVDAYAALGHDFLMLSDHDCFTDPSELDPRGMVLIPGNEITEYGPHMLHVNAHRRIMPDPDRQGLIEAIETDGGFCIIDHPNWMEDFNHCDQSLLESWQGYVGIEICNGICLRLEGSHLATDRWDRLLSKGRRVWGFANDDSHQEYDRGRAWIVVQAEKRNPGYIVRAMRQGRFYASTGVVLDTLRVEEGPTIVVESSNTQAYRVITEHGRCVAEIEELVLRYRLGAESVQRYIRIECFGQGTRMAWTQPFFIEE